MTLTEEILVKYADGVLDHEHVQAVEDLLVGDEVAAERLRLIQLSGEALAVSRQGGEVPFSTDSLVEKLLASEDFRIAPAVKAASDVIPLVPKSRSAESNSGNSNYFGNIRAIAAGIALCAFGAASGYQGAQYFGLLSPVSAEDAQLAKLPTWIVRVVDYHTLYDRETVNTSKATPDEILAMETRFSDSMDRSVSVPDLDANDLEFRRGQILKFRDVPIVQLAYLPNQTGRPVALCLKPTDADDKAATFEEVRGMGVVRWTADGVDHVLVGYLSEKRLMASAKSAARQFAKKTL